MSKMTMAGKREETSNYMKLMWSVSKTGQITEKFDSNKSTKTMQEFYT